jgi:hypothetical protein
MIVIFAVTTLGVITLKIKKVKALPTTGNCFKYLCKRFSHFPEVKHKEDVFVGPDIIKLMFEDFLLTMTEVETED